MVEVAKTIMRRKPTVEEAYSDGVIIAWIQTTWIAMGPIPESQKLTK